MKGLQGFITSPRMQGKLSSRAVTRLFGWLALRRFPRPVLRYLIRKYVAAFDIDMKEYDFDPQNATRFQDFFLRKFKPGRRSFNGTIASPAEGYVTASGAIEKFRLWQVKGSYYELKNLIGSESISSGSFVTIYLGLGDYHHVHLPFDAIVEQVSPISGHFYATNQKALHQRPQVYCENERIVLSGSCSLGKFALVLVGATCVGKIRLSEQLFENEQLPLKLRQGERIACFEMGSTVILILENDVFGEVNYKQGQRILLGEQMIG